MSYVTETVLEINLNHLEHNFNYLKSNLSGNTKMLSVVKAFAYGSDAEKVALKLQELGTDYFAVAYTKEGIALRKAGVTQPILVLHPQVSNLKELIDNCLEPSLYNARILNAFIKVASALNQKNYPVHIKFNTGLNRLGFFDSDVSNVTEKLNVTTAVKAVSVFSHLAASEDHSEENFTKTQIETFNTIVKDFKQQYAAEIFLHLCNTSGILNYPEAHFDMVRTGIGLYGFGNDPAYNKHLKPIASLKSIISQIHHVEKGESVGYNRAYKTTDFITTATIPIGHADGISRQFGNEVGCVWVNGQKAPIIGNVCMDMIMINITSIDCKEGDEVVIFDQEHTASQLANSARTISYEIITAISQRVTRLFIE